MADSRPEKVLKELKEAFTMLKWEAASDAPFNTLIVTMISQNTADRNTRRAFENLSSKFRITPEVLANTSTTQIEQCLKVGGLYRNKAKKIKQMSKMLLEEYDGSLNQILSLPLEEARKMLMQLPGVGPKTADVVLLFCAKKPTIPVDTHVNRVSKRLGLAPERGDYERVRRSLQSLYNPKDYAAVHVLLIGQGRRYCKARRPLCAECPVNTFCPSRYLWDKDD
jgi:endonuclease-3